MQRRLLKENERGFSMVELLILLGMMASLAALSIPALTSAARDMRLIADAKNIATTINYAKMSAASQMTCYRMTFTPGTSEWSLLRLNRATGNYELQQSAHRLSEGVSNSGIFFKANSPSGPSGLPTATATTLTFNSRGIPVEGVSAIYLINQNKSFAVSVSLTGKVQFWRLESDGWKAK